MPKQVYGFRSYAWPYSAAYLYMQCTNTETMRLPHSLNKQKHGKRFACRVCFSFYPPDRKCVLVGLLLTSAGGLPPTVFTLPSSAQGGRSAIRPRRLGSRYPNVVGSIDTGPRIGQDVCGIPLFIASRSRNTPTAVPRKCPRSHRTDRRLRSVPAYCRRRPPALPE